MLFLPCSSKTAKLLLEHTNTNVIKGLYRKFSNERLFNFSIFEGVFIRGRRL